VFVLCLRFGVLFGVGVSGRSMFGSISMLGVCSMLGFGVLFGVGVSGRSMFGVCSMFGIVLWGLGFYSASVKLSINQPTGLWSPPFTQCLDFMKLT